MERTEHEEIIESNTEKDRAKEKELRLSVERVNAWKELFHKKDLHIIANEINLFYRKDKEGKFFVEIGYEGEIEGTVIKEQIKEHELNMEKWNLLFKEDKPDRIAYVINSYYIDSYYKENKRCLFVVDMQG